MLCHKRAEERDPVSSAASAAALFLLGDRGWVLGERLEVGQPLELGTFLLLGVT